MLRIAHRGASGYAPENTLLSFQKAIELGVDMIELDVRLSQNGDVMVIHDERVDRTTNGRGRVIQKNTEELKILNAGNNEKIPTLQEALDCIARKTTVNINVKETRAIEPTIKILEYYIVKKGWKTEELILSSSKFFKLGRMKMKYQFLQIAPLLVFFPLLLAKTIYSSQPDFYQVQKKFISKKLIHFAHEKNIKVLVWTVNDKRSITKMKELGVDGIISNYPDRI